MLKFGNIFIEDKNLRWLLLDWLVLWNGLFFDFLFFGRFFLLNVNFAQAGVYLILGYLVHFRHLSSLPFLDDFSLALLILIPLIAGVSRWGSRCRLFGRLNNIQVC